MLKTLLILILAQIERIEERLVQEESMLQKIDQASSAIFCV